MSDNKIVTIWLSIVFLVVLFVGKPDLHDVIMNVVSGGEYVLPKAK